MWALLVAMMFLASPALATQQIHIHVTCLSGKSGDVDCPMEKTIQACGTAFCHPTTGTAPKACFSGTTEIKCTDGATTGTKATIKQTK